VARWFALAASCLMCAAHAAEVAPLRGPQLGVSIKGLAYPESLRKDLASGLTNRVLLRITLTAGSQTLGERVVEIAVKYDLWDEKFAVTTTNGANTVVATYTRVEEVLALLADLKLPNLFVQNESRSGARMLRVDALLNPIDKERMEKIRKWVSENSSYTPAGRSGSDAASPPTSTGANAIFKRIFEQYATGTDLAAVWRESVASQEFELSAAQ